MGTLIAPLFDGFVDFFVRFPIFFDRICRMNEKKEKNYENY